MLLSYSEVAELPAHLHAFSGDIYQFPEQFGESQALQKYFPFDVFLSSPVLAAFRVVLRSAIFICLAYAACASST
jgi:hypothetical protein